MASAKVSNQPVIGGVLFEKAHVVGALDHLDRRLRCHGSQFVIFGADNDVLVAGKSRLVCPQIVLSMPQPRVRMMQGAPAGPLRST